jgi:DNA invertase Pin-like site-specific DNA recombinase
MRFVAYYRVSTQRQGASGLGLEAQRSAVEAFVAQRGGQVLAERVEVESGKRNDRPELAEALAEAKRLGAVLLIAKLDRLARNVAFISALLESGVEVQAADMPEANKFMLHIMAAVAEHEAAAISARTKAALAAAKARGVKLGWSIPERGEEAKAASAAAAERRVAEADRFAGQVGPLVQALAGEGRSLRAIAAELNDRGITTPRGKAWAATSVRNVLARLEAA